MKVDFYSSQAYDIESFNLVNQAYNHELEFHEYALDEETVELVKNVTCICVFVNDKLNKNVLKKLDVAGVRLVALRCAGFNNIDLHTANELGITVVRVPAYSPEAVAEHAINLMLSLSRHTPQAYNRVRENNFSLNGLTGFELSHSTIGIVGTGKIGKTLARILNGFGSRLLAYDPSPDDDCKKLGIEYVDFSTLCQQSDVISLHCPLTPETKHIINQASIKLMSDGVMIINTSRGAVIDSQAIIEGLQSRKIGYLGLDVYEQEENLFFKDLSEQSLDDETFRQLLAYPNVIITGHQAFLTDHALQQIAETTLSNISRFESNNDCLHCCHI